MVKKRTKQNIIKGKNEHHLQKKVESSLKYLRSSNNYLVITTGLFIFFFIIGFIIPYSVPSEILEPLLQEIQNWIDKIMKETQGFGFIEMWGYIFSNNAFIGFIAIASGFMLGIIPVFLLISNGIGIGLISSLVSREVGFISLWRLFPHGIFEIPAIVISFAIGIKFAGFVLSKNPWKEFKSRFYDSMKVFIFIVVPLLTLAAIIESALIVFGK